ncbi:hypothetical protein MTO96_040440, partial [Rhipicephalus appendiculatus]
MLAFACCALFFSSVLGTEFLDLKGDCPGPQRNPGSPVKSCDYYCSRDGGYVKGHFENGTGCE